MIIFFKFLFKFYIFLESKLSFLAVLVNEILRIYISNNIIIKSYLNLGI